MMTVSVSCVDMLHTGLQKQIAEVIRTSIIGILRDPDIALKVSQIRHFTG